MMGDKKWLLGILICLSFLNILAWLAVYDLSKSQSLEVTFFDVGQGDAIFIETPERQQILIDGGPTSVIIEKLAKEMPFWDRTIDLIILTHPEKDHLSGLLEVLKRYKVENILWTGIVRDTSEYKEWLKLLQEEKANMKIAKAGQIINSGRTVLRILYPLDGFSGREFKDSNNTSIVSALDFGENSFLFTGDILKSGENELAESEAGIRADVLKIAHHGSKTSSSEEFLKEVSPEIAVIQAGKNNSYGHPHQEVLQRLEKYDIKILRNDKDGDIKIISDGINYQLSTNH